MKNYVLLCIRKLPWLKSPTLKLACNAGLAALINDFVLGLCVSFGLVCVPTQSANSYVALKRSSIIKICQHTEN